MVLGGLGLGLGSIAALVLSGRVLRYGRSRDSDRDRESTLSSRLRIADGSCIGHTHIEQRQCWKPELKPWLGDSIVVGRWSLAVVVVKLYACCSWSNAMGVAGDTMAMRQETQCQRARQQHASNYASTVRSNAPEAEIAMR